MGLPSVFRTRILPAPVLPTSVQVAAPLPFLFFTFPPSPPSTHCPFPSLSGVPKRSLDLSPRVCVYLDCVHSSEFGSSMCVCCILPPTGWHPAGPGTCPCSCAGCQPVGALRGDPPVSAPDPVPWNDTAGVLARRCGAPAGSGVPECEAGRAFASTLTFSSSSPCHLSLLFLGPSVDSGGGRPSKRFRELLPTSVLCAYPGCSVLTPFNSVTGTPARCCGSAHERIFLRLDQCPSIVEGPLISICVYGPGLGAWAPIELLVSLDMLVGAFAAYVLAVFLECSPLEESSFHRLWQIRLMPGARIVHDSDSYLLFPPASGHTIEWRSRDQGATVRRVGIRLHSVLSLTRLPLFTSLPGADSDTDPLGSESAGGSSPDRAIIPGLCDCLRCSHPSVEGGFRCSSCSWTQMDPCPCVCSGCHRFTPGGDPQFVCLLPGCLDLGYYDPLTQQQERCCGIAHEQMFVRLENCSSVLPDGPYFSFFVYGPDHEVHSPPVELLMSSGCRNMRQPQKLASCWVGTGRNPRAVPTTAAGISQL